MANLESHLVRRVLVNFRVDPEPVRRFLPPGLEADLVGDAAMVGICAIRLRRIRPARLPGVIGLSAENVAHRIAVRDEATGVRGVFVARRDTGSRLAAALGSVGFPRTSAALGSLPTTTASGSR